MKRAGVGQEGSNIRGNELVGRPMPLMGGKWRCRWVPILTIFSLFSIVFQDN